MDTDYKILSVKALRSYDTQYGTMQPYALTLEGVEGSVQLSQKPETDAPVVGQTIHGHTYEQSGQHGNFLKFKKVNPEYPSNAASKPAQSSDMGYVVTLLEAIAKAVDADVSLKSETDAMIDDGDPIELENIPF